MVACETGFWVKLTDLKFIGCNLIMGELRVWRKYITHQVCRLERRNACRFLMPRNKGHRWLVRRLRFPLPVDKAVWVEVERNFLSQPIMNPRHYYSLYNTTTPPLQRRRTSPCRLHSDLHYLYLLHLHRSLSPVNKKIRDR